MFHFLASQDQLLRAVCIHDDIITYFVFNFKRKVLSRHWKPAIIFAQVPHRAVTGRVIRIGSKAGILLR